MAAKLTAQERTFVVKYTGEAKGNGTLAAKLAGYAGNANTLGVQSNRLLRKAKVRGAIQAILDAKEKRGLAAAAERDELLSSIARNPFLEAHERISAIKELNKVEGRHSLTLIHKGKLTLEQAMGLSREEDV